MKRKLPPLNSLRTFEVAARHLSFTEAAKELFVTQAAVSQQVKHLEAWLGLKLFFRRNRSLVLTEAGSRYLNDLTSIFEQLDKATQAILVRPADNCLTISVLSSLASKWLVPRISDFIELYPDIELRLHTTDRLVDFVREGIDIGIRFGDGDYLGVESVHLMSEEIFPVCSPKLLTASRPLNSPEDLRHHTLLRDSLRMADWQTWLMKADVVDVDPTKGMGFTNSAILLDAAIEGQGVAMGRRALAEADMKAGRLVEPFDLRITTQQAYYLVYPAEMVEAEKIQMFIAWIKAQVHLN